MPGDASHRAFITKKKKETKSCKEKEIEELGKGDKKNKRQK